MKKTFKSMFMGLLIGLVSSPLLTTNGFAAASGNYTDLLPVGAAGNTTVISNGSGWSLTTLPPTNTFGDSLSRIVDTVYQSTTVATLSNSIVGSSLTALSGQGYVGSTSFPKAWIASGRSMRVTMSGRYNTVSTPLSTWTWGVNVGTTTILTTGAVNYNAGQSTQPFTASALLTIAATGASGSINGTYDIFVGSSAVNTALVNYSTSTASAVSIDLTTQGTYSVFPTFKWGTASQANNLTIINLVIELLN